MTDKHTCDRCGHNFNDITNFRRHLLRKKVCEDKVSKVAIEVLREKYIPPKKDKNIPCPTCDKMFSTSNGLYLHRSKCKKTKIEQAQIDMLKEMYESCKNQAEMISSILVKMNADKPSSSQITINNIQNTNIYTIVYNNYGNEDLSYITDNHVLLNHCINNPKSGMRKLIENIHFNPKHPENHTLRSRSLKQKIFEKRIDDTWVPCDMSNTLDELIRKGYRVLSTFYNDNIANDSQIYEDEIKHEALQKFRFLADTTCNDYYSVKRDLKLLIDEGTMYLLEASPQP